MLCSHDLKLVSPKLNKQSVKVLWTSVKSPGYRPNDQYPARSFSECSPALLSKLNGRVNEETKCFRMIFKRHALFVFAIIFMLKFLLEEYVFTLSHMFFHDKP